MRSKAGDFLADEDREALAAIMVAARRHPDGKVIFVLAAAVSLVVASFREEEREEIVEIFTQLLRDGLLKSYN